MNAKLAKFECDKEEVCSNTEGSYNCQCQDGYIAGPEGKCVLKKTNNKKVKKKMNKGTPPQQDSRHKLPAWYTTVVPFCFFVFLFTNTANPPCTSHQESFCLLPW